MQPLQADQIAELHIRIAILEAQLKRARTWACAWRAAAYIRRDAMRDMVQYRVTAPEKAATRH